VGDSVGISEGAVLSSMDGTPRRNPGPSEDVTLVLGAAVRLRSSGAAVAHCGSATRASIVTLASDLIEDRRLNDSRRRPGLVVVVVVVVHSAIDALRRARVR